MNQDNHGAGRRWRTASAASVAALCLAIAHGATAQDETRKASAQSLFEAARKLMTERNYAEACPKFAASQKLDPAIGTLLNLANCYEKQGKVASAWATFREAVDVAKAASDARREEEALYRSALLLPKLSKLTITAPPGSPEGLAIRVNDVDMAPAMLGTPMPLDPGTITVHARAKGKKEWRTTVNLGPDAAMLQVAIPPWEEAPVDAAAPVASAGSSSPVLPASFDGDQSPAKRGSTQRTVGLVVGGVGVVALATGGILALSARSKWNDVKGRCPDNQCETQADVTQASDARSGANVATIVMGAGAACIVGGAALWLLAPSKSPNRVSRPVQLSPVLGQSSVGLWLHGGF